MRGIEARQAERADLPLIAGFIRELAAYEKRADEAVFTEADLEATLFGDEKCAEVLLAYVDGEAGGFAVYFFAYSTFLARPVLYLEDLFVREHLRGRGAGKVLFNELIELAHQKRCGRMEWSVLDWNESAVEFYKKLGAQAQSEWVKYRLTGAQIAALRKKRQEEAPGA